LKKILIQRSKQWRGRGQFEIQEITPDIFIDLFCHKEEMSFRIFIDVQLTDDFPFILKENTTILINSF